jgi:hypothetical protein
MARIYSVQKPDSEDDGTFCGTYAECLAYIAKWYTSAEVQGMNQTAEYHGWQIAEIDDDDDFCFGITPVTGDDLPQP